MNYFYKYKKYKNKYLNIKYIGGTTSFLDYANYIKPELIFNVVNRDQLQSIQTARFTSHATDQETQRLTRSAFGQIGTFPNGNIMIAEQPDRGGTFIFLTDQLTIPVSQDLKRIITVIKNDGKKTESGSKNKKSYHQYKKDIENKKKEKLKIHQEQKLNERNLGMKGTTSKKKTDNKNKKTDNINKKEIKKVKKGDKKPEKKTNKQNKKKGKN